MKLLSTTALLATLISLTSAAECIPRHNLSGDLFNNCKCHDDRTGVQDDAATAFACAHYTDSQGTKAVYDAAPHHQCHNNIFFVVHESYGGICSKTWDDKCKEYSPHMYWFCWKS